MIYIDAIRCYFLIYGFYSQSLRWRTIWCVLFHVSWHILEVAVSVVGPNNFKTPLLCLSAAWLPCVTLNIVSSLTQTRSQTNRLTGIRGHRSAFLEVSGYSRPCAESNIDCDLKNCFNVALSAYCRPVWTKAFLSVFLYLKKKHLGCEFNTFLSAEPSLVGNLLDNVASGWVFAQCPVSFQGTTQAGEVVKSHTVPDLPENSSGGIRPLIVWWDYSGTEEGLALTETFGKCHNSNESM